MSSTLARTLLGTVLVSALGAADALSSEAPAAPAPPPAGLSTPAPAGAQLYFIAPSDGDVVTPTFTVRFGLKGMGVAPAGVEMEGTGHHHLLIDQDALPDATLPLPATDHVLHFGKGQTETELTLAPGEHTLQLVLGNHLHVPHTPPVLSQKIRITVKP